MREQFDFSNKVFSNLFIIWTFEACSMQLWKFLEPTKYRMYLKSSNSVSFFQYFFYFFLIFSSDVFLCWVTVRTQCLQKNYSQSKKSGVGGERPQDRCEILLNPFVPDAHFGTAVTVFSSFLKSCSNFHIWLKRTLLDF